MSNDSNLEEKFQELISDASEKEDDEVLAEPSDHPLLLDNGVLSDPPDEEQEVEAEENNEQEAKFYPTSDEDGLYELAYEITNSAINQQNENIDEEEELEFELQVEEKASSTADTQEERIQIPVQQTVECHIFPSEQVFAMLLDVNTTIQHVKDLLSNKLKVVKEAINILSEGSSLYNSTQLEDLGFNDNEPIKLTVYVGGFRKHGDKADDPRPSRITVSVEKAEKGKRRTVTVEILRCIIRKPFLGGYRHKISGTEYHHASAQTDRDPPQPIPMTKRCRDTQTLNALGQTTQTSTTTSTQMNRREFFVSLVGDKVIIPGNYITAAEYTATREKAAILLQSHFRRFLAQKFYKQLREDAQTRIMWIRMDEIRRRRKKEERLQMSLKRKLGPRTKKDFSLIYSALENWRCDEERKIKTEGAGIPETKADLYYLLLQQCQHIATIDRKRLEVAHEAKEVRRWNFLRQAAEPNMWSTREGRKTSVETPETRLAGRLMELYNSATSDYLDLDERLEVLMAIKTTVQTSDCPLVREIISLVEREAVLIMRGVPIERLAGLRKRIATCLFLYCKNPVFNPEAGRLLMVNKPHYDGNYYCAAMEKYLPSEEFYMKATAKLVKRCKKALDLQNTAHKRQDLLHYSLLLKDLKRKEENYNDDSKVVYFMQKSDLQFLVENIWLGQSIFSGANDILDLILVRWNKYEEWSPWNCILLTNDEAQTHLNLDNVEEAYGLAFINNVKRKHMISRAHYSKVQGMAEIMRRRAIPKRIIGPSAIQSQCLSYAQVKNI